MDKTLCCRRLSLVQWARPQLKDLKKLDHVQETLQDFDTVFLENLVYVAPGENLSGDDFGKEFKIETERKVDDNEESGQYQHGQKDHIKLSVFGSLSRFYSK